MAEHVTYSGSSAVMRSSPTAAEGHKPLAIITGASSGIGRELARTCGHNGFDIVIVADSSKINGVAQEFNGTGITARAIEADLSTEQGVDKLYDEINATGRSVDVLCANAGRGLGHAFLDQDFNEVKDVINTNITGTIYLLQKFGRDMRDRRQGRILITGSIAGFIPGTYQAVYNGTKAFIDSFSYALRHELNDAGVTVTCLMPGATETEFFDTAGMQDTKIGEAKKDDPADVAKTGFDAMMKGEGSIVHGLKNKLQTAAAGILPQGILAEAHAKQAKPNNEQRS